ncbi:hypothetical protein [Bacillus cereus]|uniref:hypothetical protein n=1 Tax=Bacillus cereus TaxID=1396 RepID=UPI000B4C11EE|nr:hypothetical protein [Bacillus cereus]
MKTHIQENDTVEKTPYILENWVPREWVRIWRRKDRERKKEVTYLQRSIATKNQRIRELEIQISELTNSNDKS